jgi:hypothetical protein
MEVYDFTSMYDKFVHSDMKEQQRSLTTQVFDFMNGIKVFPELDEFLGRRGYQREIKLLCSE